MASLRFLFIPVSSTDGIGEYSRSLLIANHVKALWPDASIAFVLNKRVKYFSQCPYPVYPTEGSATKDSEAVLNVLRQFVPNFVLFDASGRAKHFKEAKKLGAKVGFISQHAKKRARGLKLNRLSYIDFHWVVQPSFAIEPLSLFQRCKLALLSAKSPVNVGAVFDKPSSNELNELKSRLNLPKHFVLFNAGSGGFKRQNQSAPADEKRDSSSDYCIDIMHRAACQFTEQSSVSSVVVFGDNYPNKLPEPSSSTPHVMTLKSLSHKDFIGLLMLADARVICAGDTLLQSIALCLSSFSTAVTKDQPKRLITCSKLGLTTEVNLNEIDIKKALINFITPKSNKRNYTESALIEYSADTKNGLEHILNDIKEVLMH